MKDICKKISTVLSMVFGYGIMIVLFAGGLIFFGYVVALIIGGSIGALISSFIYKNIIPFIIYASNILVLLGLVVMYLNNELTLTFGKEKAVKHEGEV